MSPKLVEKTDGQGNTYMVEDPDFTEEFRKKYRNPQTHLIPKKKKRKK